MARRPIRHRTVTLPKAAQHWLLMITTALPVLASAVALPQERSPEDRSLVQSRLGDRWELVVQRLAIALVDAEARGKEAPLFFAEAGVGGLTGPIDQTPAVFRGRFDNQFALSAAAHTLPDMTPAKTLGDEVTQAAARLEGTPAALPPELVRALIPPPEAVYTSELAATRWLLSTLSCTDGDRIGIIVLWNPPAQTGASALETEEVDLYHHLSFVLLKGKVDSLGRWRIALARYGTAAEALAQ